MPCNSSYTVYLVMSLRNYSSHSSQSSLKTQHAFKLKKGKNVVVVSKFTGKAGKPLRRDNLFMSVTQKFPGKKVYTSTP